MLFVILLSEYLGLALAAFAGWETQEITEQHSVKLQKHCYNAISILELTGDRTHDYDLNAEN